MVVLLGSLIGLLALLVAAAPFILGRRESGAATDPVQQLQQQRQALYDDVVLLNNDYNVGQLTAQEYHSRLYRYRVRAARLMQEEETLAKLVMQIEDEVLAFRETTDATGVTYEAPVCPDCSRMLAAEDNQCPDCGAFPSGAVPHGDAS